MRLVNSTLDENALTCHVDNFVFSCPQYALVRNLYIPDCLSISNHHRMIPGALLASERDPSGIYLC